jgi:hypothetical protein
VSSSRPPEEGGQELADDEREVLKAALVQAEREIRKAG